MAVTEGDRARVDALRGAAGAGYAREWGLFCDYTAATGHPTLPTTVEALAGFLTKFPAAHATLVRRVRAIAAAHRRAGHLLDRPDTGPAAAPAGRAPTPRPEAGLMIAACSTRGWPTGLAGRRDAYLVVLTQVLGLDHHQARALGSVDVTTGRGCEGAAVLEVAGQTVPGTDDPRTCAACAVVRWLVVLGELDGWGRYSARALLVDAHAATAGDPHRHAPARPERWRGAATLLPAIDRHGWHDDYRPMSVRSIRARLAAATRGAQRDPLTEQPVVATPLPPPALSREHVAASADLEDALGHLEDVAGDAEALNARIAELLATGRRRP